MKTCTYCGRESQDEVQQCGGCGEVEFSDSASVRIPTAPFRSSWLNYGLWIGGMLLAVGFYILSLGPVIRYGCIVTTTVPTAIGNRGTRAIGRTVTYPRWVQILYYPAISLQTGPFGQAYRSYLSWWMN